MKVFKKQIENLGFKISESGKYAFHTKYGLVYGKTNTEILSEINNRISEIDGRLEAKTESKDLLQDAIDMIDVNLLNTLDYGCEIDLNDEYTLYHYSEEEIIVLVKTAEWEEIYQLANYKDSEILFEVL